VSGTYEHNGDIYTILETAEDVTDEILELAITCAEDSRYFNNDPRIDWDRVWDFLETEGYDVENTDSPAARKIQRYVRKQNLDESTP